MHSTNVYCFHKWYNWPFDVCKPKMFRKLEIISYSHLKDTKITAFIWLIYAYYMYIITNNKNYKFT